MATPVTRSESDRLVTVWCGETIMNELLTVCDR